MNKAFDRLQQASALALAMTGMQAAVLPDASAQQFTPPPLQAPSATPAPAERPQVPGAATAAPASPGPIDTGQAADEAARLQRYQALRAGAAEFGLDLPEAPPAGNIPPAVLPPIHAMTPEERRAMWEQRWQERRKEAAAHGIDLPETPPWVEAEKRRQAMQERFEQYRKTVEQLSEEQREAARAFFGRRMYASPPAWTDWHTPGDAWNDVPPCHRKPHPMPNPAAAPETEAPAGQDVMAPPPASPAQ